MLDQKQFGIEIKKLRLKRGENITELAKKLGVYHTILEQWELKIDNVMPKYHLFKKYIKLAISPKYANCICPASIINPNTQPKIRANTVSFFLTRSSET